MFPRPAELLRAPAATGLMVLAVLVYVALSHNIDALVMNPLAVGPEPGRFVTSVLPHVGIIHLVFNLYWLAVLGVFLELDRGTAFFVGFTCTCAIASSGLEYGFLSGGVGLSGVGYGLFAYAWVARRNHAGWAARCTDSVVRTFVGWFFFCIATTVTHVFEVANLAHAMGAAMGGLWGLTQSAPRARWAARAGGLVLLALAIGASYSPVRERINFTDDVAHQQMVEAYGLLSGPAPDVVRVEQLLRQGLKRLPQRVDGWFNLGIAASRQGHLEDAVDAYAHAWALEQSDSNRDAVVAARYAWAIELLKKDTPAHRAEGIRQLETCFALKPNDPAVQSALKIARHASESKRAGDVEAHPPTAE